VVVVCLLELGGEFDVLCFIIVELGWCDVLGYGLFVV